MFDTLLERDAEPQDRARPAPSLPKPWRPRSGSSSCARASSSTTASRWTPRPSSSPGAHRRRQAQAARRHAVGAAQPRRGRGPATPCASTPRRRGRSWTPNVDHAADPGRRSTTARRTWPTWPGTPWAPGPFKFVRWVKDDRIELEANEQYWRGAPQDEVARVPAHPRRRRARGRAPERRDRRGGEHPAAPGEHHRQPPAPLPLHRAERAHHPAHVLHASVRRPAQAGGPLPGPGGGQARAPGHEPRRRRGRAHQGSAGRQGHPRGHDAHDQPLRVRSAAQAHQAGPRQDQAAPHRGRASRAASTWSSTRPRAATCATRRWRRPSPASSPRRGSAPPCASTSGATTSTTWPTCTRRGRCG